MNAMKRAQRRMLIESPGRIDDYDKDEQISGLSKEDNLEELSTFFIKNAPYTIKVDNDSKQIFIFASISNELAGEFIYDFREHDNSLYVDFPIQNPKYRGVIRQAYKHLLEKKTVESIISGNIQTLKAFQMWEKLSRDNVLKVSVLNNQTNTISDVEPEQLIQYWGSGKEHFQFILTLK
jgi:hypothetical protein